MLFSDESFMYLEHAGRSKKRETEVVKWFYRAYAQNFSFICKIASHGYFYAFLYVLKPPKKVNEEKSQECFSKSQNNFREVCPEKEKN